MAGSMVRVAPALLLVFATGCFSYRPAAVSELAPGVTVRAYLTTEQAREIGEVVTLQGRRLTGTVAERAGDRLLVDVRVASLDDGAGMLRQRVAVPVAEVLEVEERVLNGWATALVVGGVAALVGGLVAWQLKQEDNSPVRNPKNPPDAARIPVLRIGLPLPGAP